MNNKDQKQNSAQTQPSVDIHDRVAEAYYGLMGPKFMRDTQGRIHWICRHIQGKNVLDVGCSQGIVPILLAREGLKVIGIDSSPKAIDEATKYLGNEPKQVRKQVSFVNADFLSWDHHGAKVDTVVMSEVLEHLTRPESFLETAARILPKKGRLIVTVPFGINDFIDHKHTFYLLEPLRLISKHFDVAEIEILGKWLGVVADRRTAANSRTEPFQPTIGVMEKLEGAFGQTERVLRDELTVIRKKLEEANQKYRGVTEQVSTLKQRMTEEERARQVAEQGQRQAAGQLEQAQCYLKEEQAALQQQVAQLSQQEHAHCAAADEAAKNLLCLKTELETMRGKLEEANQKYRGATEQVSTLKQRVTEEEKARQTGEQAQAQASTKQKAELEAMRGKLEEANQKYRVATEQISTLKQQVAQEEAACQATTKLKAELEAMRGKLEETNQKYRAATEQVTVLKQQVSRNEAMQQGAEQARAQASAQLAEVQRSFQEERKVLQQQLAQSSQEGQAKTVTVHEGEKKLIRLEAELEAHSRLEEANQKYQTATEQTTTLQQQLAQSTAEAQAKTIAVQEAEKQVVRLEGELGTVRGRLEEANQQYRGVTEQVTKLTQRMTEEERARQTAEQALAQASTQLEQAQRSLQGERNALQQQLAQSTAEAQAKTIAVQEANLKYRGATEKLSALEEQRRQQLAQRESDLTQIKQRLASTEIDTRSSIEQVTELEKANEKLLNSVQKLERAQQVKMARLQAMERRTNAAVQQADKVRSTLSFQLGYALIHGFKSWNGLRNLPSTLWGIRREAISKHNKLNPKPESRQAGTIISSVKLLNESATEDLCLPSGTPKRQPLEKLLKDLRSLPVACVVDEFTYHSFKHECDLHQIRSASWEQDLEKLQPNIMFIESAWRGIENSWAKKVSNPSAEIKGVIDWCVKNSVPTLLWCKEDPQHFDRFLHIARAVDYIFTTDIDCIASYKQEVGHDRVYLLPFAAQPAIHNPIEIYQRKDALNFAGSYYWRYPERQRDFKTIVDMAKSVRPVEIYDRNFSKPQPHDFVFPQEYVPYILGDLPFDQIDKAYKGYRYGINMNTIKQSQTMFARRVFELLASNTVVISNFSRGVRIFFGSLVVCSDSPTELRRQLESVAGDEIRYRKYRLAGLRKVMSEHTYAHRMAYIATKITGIHTSVHRPEVFMLGIPTSLAEARHMVRTFERQSYQNRTLCLIGSRYSEFKAPRICCVSSVDEVQSLCAKGGFIAPVSADDYYGPNYLTDLVLATAYSDTPVIGKGTHFEFHSETVTLAHADQQYHYVNKLPVRASLISLELFAGLGIQTASDLAECFVNHQRSLSIDEFNYCRGSSMVPGEHVLRLVNDDSGLDAGLSWMETISPAAEKIHAVTGVSISNDEGKLPGLDPAMWFALLPKKIPIELEFKAEGNEINIRSTLLGEKHLYVYLTKKFTRAELNFDRNDCFKMTGTSNIDVRTVFVFLDEHGQKIGHTMNIVGTPHRLSIPSNCRNFQLGLRVQGAGSASLGRIVLGDLRKRPSVLLSKSCYLVLSKQYPAYDDLYRYGFLHSRVRAYQQQGLKIDLFKLSDQANTEYREFEGVDVLTSDHVLLDTVLRQGMHTHVLVHYLDKNIWEVLSRYLDRVNVIVWVHGAEIQPWYRRAIKFNSDVERHKAREASDQRQTVWLEMLERPHPNLCLVFPSRYLAQQAMADLGIELLETQYKVIPNFIDGNQFVYHRKPVEHRLRVLSIRPFASAIYANDMTVKAIRILSEEPFFNKLHFRIVGDGPLFEQTVKPLQDMHNVVLERRFLSHAEISALHQEYGIFLVPSRMDSQGVSRDEAMASGLVPITNRVAAIPEFVDESCAFLADPEDAEGLADGIRRLYHDPALFLRMSQASAEHVRNKCGYKDTIERELGLLSSTYRPAEPKCQIAPKGRASYKVAIYGDVNLNITDGSAIWAASLAETLAGLKDVHVTLYLKARIHSTHIIAPLLNLSANLRLVEPNLEHGKNLSPNQALERIKADDAITGYDGIILRGLDLCATAACSKELRGRIWPYITDMPESSEHITTEIAERIKRIIDAAAYVLCQTRQFEAHLVSNFPTVEGKTRLLSPMIPKIVVSCSRTPGQEEPIRIVYAGKFAPLWGIREMFEAFDDLREANPDAELHIYGDKIHNPPDDPGFQNEIRQRLESGRGIVWHRAVERETLMRDLQKYNIGWAYRHAQLEANTHELSTKVLEYAACGLPVILARNGINEDVFGAEYPLYVDSAHSASALLRRIADDSDLYAKAVARMTEVSRDFSFESVRKRLLRQQLFQANLQPKNSGLNYAA